MAIDEGTKTVVSTGEERTWRVEIFCEKGDDPTVRAHRQFVGIAADGSIMARESRGAVERTLSATAAQEFTVGGKTVTVAELAAVISDIADTWRREDMAAAPAQTLLAAPAVVPEVQ